MSFCRWEYKFVSINGFDTVEVLNQCGLEGWELVAVTPESSYSGAMAYFKRPLLGAIAP